MLSRTCLSALFVATLVLARPLRAAERPDDAPATAITIYADPAHAGNQAHGRALVQQRRRLELPQGESRVELPDVPASLDPASVLLRPSGDDAAFSILEQSIQSVATDPDSVLRQYIGHDVLINRTQQATGQQQQSMRVTETINAKLLAFDDKVIVLQTNNRQLPIQIIARGPDVSEIKLMRPPTMPPTRPTLSLLVAAEKAGARNVDLIYEARGLAWDASYTLLLDDDGSTGSLEAWANLVNRSGASFDDATVRLADGQDGSRRYLLPRRITLPADGTRRVALMESSRRVNVSRTNVFEAHVGAEVSEAFSVVNAQENQLGIALPPGRVRVLRSAPDAPMALVADSNVSATAVGNALVMRTGRADGLVAARDVTESHETIDGDRRVARVTKVTVGNRRKENARVLVVEQLNAGARRVIQHSQPYEGGAGADAITFVLDVPPGEAKSLSFAVAVDGG